MNGFTITTRKKLHALFEKWGFPDNSFSPIFDDGEQLRKFLKQEGWSERDIKNELEAYKKELGE